MFETHESARVPFRLVMEPAGTQLWRFVQRRLHIPFLHVTFSRPEYDGCQSIILLEEPSDLVEFSEIDGISLGDVDLVTPGYVNGSDRWKMGALKEIWVSEREAAAEYVYILDDGTRYSSLPCEEAASDLSEYRRFFSI